MSALNFTIKPTINGNFASRLDNGRTVLSAHCLLKRDDQQFCGVSVDVQASAGAFNDRPDAVDSELFYQAVALLNAAPALLEALEGMVELFGGEYGANLETVNVAREALRLATTHPLHDELEAAEIAYEESQEMARAKAADRADRYADDDMDVVDPDPYLHSDIDPETLTSAAEFDREVAEGR